MPALKQSEINAAAETGHAVAFFAISGKGLTRQQFPHPSFEETVTLSPKLASEAVAFWLALVERAEKGE